MRISDWSSDVCSSDLRCPRCAWSFAQHPLHDDDVEPAAQLAPDLPLGADDLEAARLVQCDRRIVAADDAGHAGVEPVVDGGRDALAHDELADASPVVVRSEERRVGTEWGSTCSTR